MKEYSPLFIFLQETWLPHHEVNVISNDFKDYNFQTTSSDMFEHAEDLLLKSGPTWHGTAIGWKKSIDDNVIRLPVVSDRFCSVKYVSPSSRESVVLYSIYLPTSGCDDLFLETLEVLNYDVLNNLSSSDSLILAADMNVSRNSSKRRANAFKTFTSMHEIKTIMTSLVPTFHHNNQTSESQLDHIYVFTPSLSDVNLKFNRLLCLKDDSSNLSSHDVIVAKLNIPVTCENNVEYKNESPSYTPFKIIKPNWTTLRKDEYQKETADQTNNLLINYGIDIEFIPELCEMFSRSLVMCAKSNSETKSLDTLKSHMKDDHKQYPYFSPEYRAAHKALKVAFQQWRKAGRPTDHSHPAKSLVLNSRRHLQSIARGEELAKSRRLNDELMDSFKHDVKDVYSTLKKFRRDVSTNKDLDHIDTLAGKFYGEHILDGFASNTEILCGVDSIKAQKYDSELLNRIKDDNHIILDLTTREQTSIEHISLPQLKDIIHKKLKPNKACDIFQLTVEHLRNDGDDTLTTLVKIINLIIDNINCISAVQLNTSIATLLYKGKGKAVSHHKSYRLVRVTPLIGRLLDEHMRPALVKIVKPIQNENQYGFTENMSYMLGALQRHEVEKFCFDSKQTFFGCSLDGDSAFEVVDRDIQIHELYFAGQVGDHWKASHYSYKSSLTKIKYKGNLSREIEENLGVKQGRNLSSDHYKVYIAPLLKALDEAQLGVQIGPINCSVSGVADDVYLMTNRQTNLQSQLDIAAHYGHMYRIEYGAGKTKITVKGSEIDQNYYNDVSPWTMNGEPVNVVENNEHLGQIVSSKSQEEKNIDLRIAKSRNCLFSLFGIGFAFKCFLSPVLKLHIYKTYISPIMLSGLSSFALKSSQIEPLSVFQRKTLKSFLKLSSTAPTPAIHFLTGELPIEGKIHKETLTLFHNVWSNPRTKIFQIVKYLLETSPENSRTWAVHVRRLCKKYELSDPLQYLSQDPMTKVAWKQLITTKITEHFEKYLRSLSVTNSRMEYFNTNLLGLSGRQHPAIQNMHTSWEVRISRPHLKFLSGNYITYAIKSEQSGGSSRCRICTSGKDETIFHVIIECESLDHSRNTILEDFKYLCTMTKNNITYNNLKENPKILCQFLLDPASMNLPTRVSMSDPILPAMYRLSRDLCYQLDKSRMEHIQNLKQYQHAYILQPQLSLYLISAITFWDE